MIVGTPDEVTDTIHVYAEAGVNELIIQWFAVEDLEGLQVLAEQVLPSIGVERVQTHVGPILPGVA
jgi:hypothetical protein